MSPDLTYDSSPRVIVFRELDLHPVARQKPDPVPLRRSRRMGQYRRLVPQLQLVYQAGKLLKYDGFHRLHGRVRTHGPLSVTATQCSK